ncbi:acyl-CoA dehydrogenase family protein [Streptomyces sp. NPDC012825]|uniref:acyl-CoA dehydrogenase family protein n=1 Tax=Streptomyces sp. NPDC012825 TaxID=3364851 RepID=UPI00367E4F90
MDVTPAPEHTALRQIVTDVFDDELAPLVRRMADRPRHTDAPADGPDDADVRAMVWQALTDLDVLALNQSPVPGALRGLQSLAVVAERLGEVLYQGPFADTVLTSEALLRTAPGSSRDTLLKRIAAGTSVAAAIRDGRPDPGGAPLSVDATGRLLTAERRFVVCAAEADLLLVTGRTAAGEFRTALVERDDPTVRLRRQEELSRGELYAVGLAGTPVLAWLDLDERDWRELTGSARVLQAAHLVGLSRGALRLGVAHAGERHQFGGPIGRQQSLAFTLARLATRTDSAHLLTRAAAWEADRGGDHRLTAGQCLAMAGELARDTARDVLQVHGAHGLTEGCDAQLFYRRAALDSLALGTPAQLRADVLPLLRARRRTSPPV